MSYLSWLAHSAVTLVRLHRGWMTWNLFLAIVPAVLAHQLFDRHRRRSASWWIGVLAFAAFLPNAPYVVTDLIHLRVDVYRATSESLILFAILPLYTVFILVGFLAYLAALGPLVREVRSTWPQVQRWQVEVPVHLIVSVGIVLGRIARLNSWDTISSPGTTLERTFSALSWSGAPAATIAVFVAVWLTTVATRLLVTATVHAVRVAQDALAGPDPVGRT